MIRSQVADLEKYPRESELRTIEARSLGRIRSAPLIVCELNSLLRIDFVSFFNDQKRLKAGVIDVSTYKIR